MLGLASFLRAGVVSTSAMKVLEDSDFMSSIPFQFLCLAALFPASFVTSDYGP